MRNYFAEFFLRTQKTFFLNLKKKLSLFPDIKSHLEEIFFNPVKWTFDISNDVKGFKISFKLFSFFFELSTFQYEHTLWRNIFLIQQINKTSIFRILKILHMWPEGRSLLTRMLTLLPRILWHTSCIRIFYVHVIFRELYGFFTKTFFIRYWIKCYNMFINYLNRAYTESYAVEHLNNITFE